MRFHLTCAAAAVAGILAHSAGAAQNEEQAVIHSEVLGEVTVTAPAEEPATLIIETADLPAVRGTADLLRDLPGVSGSRMGGHGIDPVIRGLSQTQLNVLLDGAYVHGGCPNRMDPPTAYAPATGYERITVIKGVQTLEYGGGGPGGTILLERVTPRFTTDDRLRASADAGYRENGDGWDLAADVAAGSPQGYARFIASHSEADNYEDGAGNEVRSAYEDTSGAILLGYTPSDDTRVEFSAERQQLRDVLFAGAGMDSPESDNDTYRLKFETADLGVLAKLRGEIYRSEVDHVMDNYTLREPANPMMMMRAPSTSDTTGGRLVTEVDSGIGRWKLGVDFQNNDRDAVRINDFNDTLNSVLWPGVSIDQTGVFAELTHGFTQADRLIAGLRYDRVSADASKADLDPPGMPMSPNALYAMYYDGAQAEERNEDNWGGLLRWEHDLANGLGTAYAGLSRTVRTADASERYIASNASSPDGRWVGNPLIDPEKHHQLELGVQLQRNAWDLEASVFYNDVDDYILRDRYHQAGNNATIYRNVSATLIGGEVTAGYRWSPNWRAGLGLAYVRAENDTDDMPIAQIPPLEAIATLDYTANKWEAGARVRAAAKQNRVDDDPMTGSGLDTGKTPGWGVVDLYGRYHFSDSVSLDIGVDNLFDKEYAQHLNRSSAFDPQQVQVNEPGMSAWIKISARF